MLGETLMGGLRGRATLAKVRMHCLIICLWIKMPDDSMPL